MRGNKMPKFFVTKEQIDKQIVITGEDAKHIKTVLRKKVGEQVTICDGEGMDYLCKIEHFEENGIYFDILEKQTCDAEPPVKVTLYQALPKSDKMELIIQKCVELGIDKIVPVTTEYCVVKLGQKEHKKIERWQKIAEAAAKQCGRAKIPVVDSVLSFQEALKQCQTLDSAIIAYEKEQKRTLKEFVKQFHEKSIGIFVGAEGGFSEQEIAQAIEQNVLPITLGKRILRTETAGMIVTAILVYEMEQGDKI